jgi:hypothetical protein
LTPSPSAPDTAGAGVGLLTLLLPEVFKHFVA